MDQEPVVGGIGATWATHFPSSLANDIDKGRPKIDARGHLVGPIGLDLGDLSVPTQLDLTRVAAAP